MKKWRSSLSLTALCAFVWLYAFPYFPAINNPNENVRLYMTAAIVEEGTYRIDEMRSRWGWTNDAACVDRFDDGEVSACETRRPAPGAEREYYSVKAPGTSLLGVPFYWLYYQLVDEVDRDVALWILRVFANILPLLVFVFFFHRWLLRRFDAPIANLAALGMVLGSCVLAYGYLFVSHSLSAAAAFGGYMLIDTQRKHQGQAWHAALAGLLTAGASLLEYPCFVVSAALSLFALTMPRRRWVPFALGALIPTLIMMHFQWVAYGNPLTPGHLYVENASFRAEHEMGFFGANRFHLDAAVRLLFDLRLGLFPQSPWLILFPAGLVLWWKSRRRADALLFGVSILLMYLSVCLLENWEGGWVVGPRYLVVLYPFLVVPSAAALQAAMERFERIGPIIMGSAVGAVAVGVLTAGLASIYYPHLPTELDHPLAQVIVPLIDSGFAPANAGHYLGLSGTASMLPIFAALLGALVWMCWVVGAPKRTLLRIGVTIVATALLVLPHVVDADPRPQALEFITSHWHPESR